MYQMKTKMLKNINRASWPIFFIEDNIRKFYQNAKDPEMTSLACSDYPCLTYSLFEIYYLQK